MHLINGKRPDGTYATLCGKPDESHRGPGTCVDCLRLAEAEERRGAAQRASAATTVCDFEDAAATGFLRLLALARAQGVHRLEVRGDGTFIADMLPLPPPSLSQPKNEKPMTPEEKLEADLFPE